MAKLRRVEIFCEDGTWQESSFSRLAKGVKFRLFESEDGLEGAGELLSEFVALNDPQPHSCGTLHIRSTRCLSP